MRIVGALGNGQVLAATMSRLSVTDTDPILITPTKLI